MIKDLLNRETLLVAVLTLGGYLVGLLYEVGFSLYFRYPASFISVDIKSIFFGLLSVALLLFFLTVIIKIMDDISRNFKGMRALILHSTIFGFILLYCGLVFYLLTGKSGIYIYAVAGAYCIFLLLLYPFGYKKNGITLEEGVVKLAVKMYGSSKVKESKLSAIRESVIAYSFVCAAMGILVISVGTHFARVNESFYTFTYDSSKYAIVNTYGENLITSRVIDNNLTTGIYIFKDSELKKLELKREKLINNLKYDDK